MNCSLNCITALYAQQKHIEKWTASIIFLELETLSVHMMYVVLYFSKTFYPKFIVKIIVFLIRRKIAKSLLQRAIL